MTLAPHRGHRACQQEDQSTNALSLHSYSVAQQQSFRSQYGCDSFGSMYRIDRRRDQRDHVIPNICRNRGVTPDLSYRARIGKTAASLCQFFSVKSHCSRGVVESFINVVSRRETTGQIREPYSRRLVRAGVFHDRDIIGHHYARSTNESTTRFSPALSKATRSLLPSTETISP